MSLDVMTLALAKSYADQHGGSGGGNTTYIPAKITNQLDDNTYTIETSVTFEQIDTAYKSGQEQILKLSDDSGEDSYSMPLIFADPGSSYNFGVILSGYGFFAEVGSTNKWSASMLDLSIHTHYNKEVLDYLYVHPDYPNKLVFYDSFVETKPAQITTKSEDITLADNTEYRLYGVARLKLTYPEGNFECWMRLSFTDYTTITVTFPPTTKYIGIAPDFKEDETWELSIKDGVVIAQKVGDGI